MRTIAAALLGLTMLAATPAETRAGDFRLHFDGGRHYGWSAPKHYSWGAPRHGGFKRGYGYHRPQVVHPGHRRGYIDRPRGRPWPGHPGRRYGANKWYGAHVPLDRVIRQLDRGHGFRVTDVDTRKGRYVLKGFGPHGHRGKLVINRHTGAIERFKRYRR